MKRIFFLLALLLDGCTRLYENGQLVASISSDCTDVRIRTPAGTVAEFGTIKNSTVHTAAGKSIAAAAIPIGTAIATSGIVK